MARQPNRGVRTFQRHHQNLRVKFSFTIIFLSLTISPSLSNRATQQGAISRSNHASCYKVGPFLFLSAAFFLQSLNLPTSLPHGGSSTDGAFCTIRTK